MAKKKDYIPKDNPGFFNWQSTLIAYVSTRLVAFGISTTQFGAVTDSQAIYEPLFAVIKNKKSSSSSDRVAHDENRTSYEKQLRTFVGEHLAKNSAVSDTDRSNMNITVPDKIKSSRPVIDTVPTVKPTSKEGSIIQLVHRVASDSSRPSIHPDADAVEVHYQIVAPGTTTLPASPDDCNRSVTSKKARVVITAGVSNAGSKLVGFSRWVNTSNLEKSSGWSQRFSVVITD